MLFVFSPSALKLSTRSELGSVDDASPTDPQSPNIFFRISNLRTSCGFTFMLFFGTISGVSLCSNPVTFHENFPLDVRKK